MLSGSSLNGMEPNRMVLRIAPLIQPASSGKVSFGNAAKEIKYQNEMPLFDYLQNLEEQFSDCAQMYLTYRHLSTLEAATSRQNPSLAFLCFTIHQPLHESAKNQWSALKFKIFYFLDMHKCEQFLE
ncbi:unnamed protein product [Gongylonema pulchrum]|uniref:Kinesin motor domain-containing protein n=1 Tax=Gongylonema pulchrum TaxID=637853 RepID=A0A183EBE7_9BILA|nr:unnamed protein product [Gongylonema pulchrum]